MSGILREAIPGVGEKGDAVKIVTTNKKLGRTTIRTATGQVATVDSYRVMAMYDEEQK